MGCGASKTVASTLSIASQDDSKLAKKRTEELTAQAAEYEYVQDDFKDGLKLPPRPKKLPEGEKIPMHIAMQMADAGKAKASLDFNKALDMVSNLFAEEDPFKDWKDLYRTTTLPAVAKDDRWRQDSEFGRQRVFGLHPNMIALVSDLPALLKKMPISDELAAPVLPSATPTLEKLVEEKKLFVCDYAEMDALRQWFPEERVACAPIVLLFVDEHDQMMPFAIQLFQAPSETNPIFTPNADQTSKGAWLCAKLHVQVADLFLHEVASHLFNTHLLAEGFYLAMMRNLHKRHPISELLREHFWGTMAVDFDGRGILVAEGAIMPRLLCAGSGGTTGLLATRMAAANAETLFDFPKIVERRGLQHIPHNPYRDDALALYDLIKTFVHDILVVTYTRGDAEVASDVELQNWIMELKATQKIAGLPSRLETLDSAVTFVAGLIFNQTANHASVNGPQWDYLGFVPNAPGRFRMTPLENPKQEVTDAEIAKNLPSFDDSCEQITVVAALAGVPSDGAKYLGEYDSKFLTGLPDALPGLAKYKKGLEDLKKTIDHRNNACKEEFVYEYLHPAKVCNSVCM